MLLDPKRPTGSADALAKRSLPAGLGRHEDLASLYVPDDRVVGAVNAALAVGMPLLLTGEPGTGKSQLAYYLSHYFGLGPPLHFNVRSTSDAADLQYSFDTVAYFHAANDKTRTDPLDKTSFRTKRELWQAFERSARGQASVVLIDEIDKAPRDFPNDLLDALDEFKIHCPYTDERLEVKRTQPRPVVVITSNSETRLPEPFLRRCIFHHLELTRSHIESIVARRATALGLRDADHQRQVLDQFLELRGRSNLRKKPGTAELLVWISLVAGDPAWRPDLRLGELPHLGALLKDRDDMAQLG